MGKIIRVLSLILFCGYLFLGFRIFPGYGVPIDEYSQIDLGRVNYERIVSGSLEIQTHYDRHYGPAFEVPLYVVSQFVSQKTGADVIAVRHLSVFLFFAVSVACFYLFLERIFKHAWYGLAGSLLLALYPRFFAESFYNSKDMTFVGVTVVSLFLLSRYNGRKIIPLLVVGIATGIGIAVRVQGLLLLGIYVIAIAGWGADTLKRRVVHAAAFLATGVGVAWASFPLFWDNFFENLIGFWRVSANQIGVATYYFGKFYTSPDLPWHYHFVWIGVSAMLSVVALSLIGVGMFFHQLTAHKKQNIFLFLCLFGIIAGTLATCVFMRPRSYDGWRHIYYVYPALITFALFSIQRLLTNKKRQSIFVARVFIVLLLVDLVGAAVFLLKNHPRQYVYFNILAGGYLHAKSQFDFDYWGISLKETHAYLTEIASQKRYRIFFDQRLPYTENSIIPSLIPKGSVVTDNPDDADIYVAVFRDKKAPPPGERFEKVYAVTVEGADLSAVYARKKP